MIIDMHCDALTKLFEHKNIHFLNEVHLDVNLQRLRQAEMLLQCFAVYIPQHIHKPGMEHVLEYIRLFHTKILTQSEMKFVRSVEDLAVLKASSQIGAMLTLEGADVLQGCVEDIELLFQLGVRCLQPTWNYANWAADGVLEPRGAGLSIKGRRLVEACNRIGMILDLSHLHQASYWEAMAITSRPVLVSHANAHAICPHPRNLRDDQIEALIQTDGRIGIAFVPYFVNHSGQATITDLLRHVDHICTLGGAKHLVLGSDFDGIDQWISGLEHPGKIQTLIDQLCKQYEPNIVEGILWKNAYTFLESALPDSSY